MARLYQCYSFSIVYINNIAFMEFAKRDKVRVTVQNIYNIIEFDKNSIYKWNNNNFNAFCLKNLVSDSDKVKTFWAKFFNK